MGSEAHQPAFPNAWEETNEHGVKFPFVTNGLTKREYFAAQALAGICANILYPDDAARSAVRVADALIKALEAPNAED